MNLKKLILIVLLCCYSFYLGAMQLARETAKATKSIKVDPTAMLNNQIMVQRTAKDLVLVETAKSKLKAKLNKFDWYHSPYKPFLYQPYSYQNIKKLRDLADQASLKSYYLPYLPGQCEDFEKFKELVDKKILKSMLLLISSYAPNDVKWLILSNLMRDALSMNRVSSNRCTDYVRARSLDLLTALFGPYNSSLGRFSIKN